uniref:Secreted protein n=1 Tax=Ixodes ricinus TaxID=34613 RepID=A0A6B0V120_IXORI
MTGRLSFSYRMCTLAMALRLATRCTLAVGHSSMAAMVARKAGNLGRRLGPGGAAGVPLLPRRSHLDENESHRPRMPGARPRLRTRSPLCLAAGAGWGAGCAGDLGRFGLGALAGFLAGVAVVAFLSLGRPTGAACGARWSVCRASRLTRTLLEASSTEATSGCSLRLRPGPGLWFMARPPPSPRRCSAP